MSKILIETLTEKQKEAMPAYRDMWIEKGLQTGETDWKTFDEFMPVCYEKANIKYPKNVVRVSSPMVGALAAAVAEGIWKKRRDAVDGAVSGAVGGAVGGAVDGAVRDAVDGAVSGAVRDAVGGAVDGAVRDAVAGAVSGAVRDAVDGAVRDAVAGAVSGAVRDAVDGAVRDAVRDAVSGAVGGAVRDAVRGAVSGAVGGAVGGAVSGAVRDAVDGAVDDAVRDAVRGAVDGAVAGAVSGAVDDAVRGAVAGAVSGAVATAISIAKKAEATITYHYWLGGQFWVGGYWWGVAFVNFFFDICKLKLSKDIMERALAYRKVCESVNYIWPNSDFVIVCARPTKINRDERGRLHSEKEIAIEYPDGWGLYILHGVRFEKEWWTKIVNDEMSPEEIFAIDNLEHRRIAYEYMDKTKMKKLKDYKVLDEVVDDGYGNPMKLISFTVKGVDEPLKYLNCFCSSTKREYYLGTNENTCWSAKSMSFGIKADEIEWLKEW